MMSEFDPFDPQQAGRLANYSPVTVTATESIGTMALAVIAVMLLLALLRSQARIRELQQPQD